MAEQLTMEALEQKMLAAEGTQRVEYLLQLTDRTFRSHTPVGLGYAKEALNLSTAIGYPRGIAFSKAFIGQCYLQLDDYDEALAMLTSAYETSNNEANDEVLTAKIRAFLGGFHVATGENLKALPLFECNLEVFTRLDNKLWMMRSLNYISAIYEQLGNHAKALEMYLYTVDFALREQLLGDIDLCYHNIAIVYFRIGDYTKALRYIDLCMERRDQQTDKRGTALTLQLLGSIYVAMEQHENALPVVQQALELFREIGVVGSTVDVYLCLGAIYTELGDADAVMPCYRKAIAIAREIKNDGFIVHSLYRIGSFFMQRKRWSPAIRCLYAAADIAQAINDRHLQYIIYDKLSMLCEKLERLSEALKYKKLYETLREEVMGGKQQQIMASIQLRYDIQKAEQEREKYYLKTKALESEIQHKTRMITSALDAATQRKKLLEKLYARLRETIAVRGNKTPLLRALLREVRESMNTRQDWQQFEVLFEEVHRDFIDRLVHQFPSMSPAETRICALLKTNLSSKEIASLLSLSERTIATHRYSIRKKLGIASDANLITCLSSL